MSQTHNLSSHICQYSIIYAEICHNYLTLPLRDRSGRCAYAQCSPTTVNCLEHGIGTEPNLET